MIGSGLYTDDTEQDIALMQQSLNRHLRDGIVRLILGGALLGLLLFLFVDRFYRWLMIDFGRFQAFDAANRTKSTFLTNMSHELRTPLNAMLGFPRLMQRDAAVPLRHRENLALVDRSGEHLLGLINNILEALYKAKEQGRNRVEATD
jgi:signal transduction histidine kinase